MSDAFLDVSDFSVKYMIGGQWRNAVENVNFSLSSGKVIAVVGESGSGKSTMVLALAGLRRGAQISGNVTFEGRSLVDMERAKLDKIRGTEIGTIFQDPGAALNPLHTIGEQISESLKVHLNLSAAEAKERVLEAMRIVGFHEAERVYKLYPYELSGGMKQRAMICMATVARPKLLIADEPTTALDTLVQASILDLLADLKAQLNLSVIFITHNLNLVAQIADEVLVMYAGQVVEAGPVEAILDDPKHPYTQLLVACNPERAKAGERLFSIPGAMPDILQHYPLDCRIANRIPSLQNVEHDGFENLNEVTDGHFVRCNCHKHFKIAEVAHAGLE